MGKQQTGGVNSACRCPYAQASIPCVWALTPSASSGSARLSSPTAAGPWLPSPASCSLSW